MRLKLIKWVKLLKQGQICVVKRFLKYHNPKEVLDYIWSSVDFHRSIKNTSISLSGLSRVHQNQFASRTTFLIRLAESSRIQMHPAKFRTVLQLNSACYLSFYISRPVG